MMMRLALWFLAIRSFMGAIAATHRADLAAAGDASNNRAQSGAADYLAGLREIRPCGHRDKTMAKPTSILIKMVSSADTGFFYVTKKNPRTQTEKLVLKKYDPVVRKHVEFKEGKIK